MRILGLSAFHRDSAAALLVDGRLVAAAQEERFTGRHLDAAFPKRAIRFCLDRAGLRARELDAVVFYEKPLRKFERLLVHQLRAFPRSSRVFARSMFLWLGDRLWLKDRIADELDIEVDRVRFVEHQLAHAAGAFYPSPFDEAAILSLDDVGEWATTLLAQGVGRSLRPLKELLFPRSLGLVVSAITQYLGFEPGRDEARVEALAARGQPGLRDRFEELVPALEDGAFSLCPESFRFAFDHEELLSPGLERRLGERRYSGMPLEVEAPADRHAQVAASLQELIEDRSLALLRHLHELSGSDALCLTGFLAQNRRLVQRLATDGPFDRVHVSSWPDDSGAAFGAALAVHHALDPEAPRVELEGRGVGPELDAGSISSGAADADEARRRLLAALGEGQSVGWARGALEFGAEARGRRCILRRVGDADAAERLRACLPGLRELPPVLAVPEERAAEYFSDPARVQEAARSGWCSLRATPDLQRVAPSAVQADGRVWPLLVRAGEDPEFHSVLLDLERRGGPPLLLHESLRLPGSPLARHAADALEVFERSGLDLLVLEDRVIDQRQAGEGRRRSR